jgi:hypothetical protein
VRDLSGDRTGIPRGSEPLSSPIPAGEVPDSVRDTAAGYALALATCGLAVIGYAATRVVPFPMLADDVGNWLEPLGVLSVLSECAVVVAAVSALLGRPRRR